METFIFMTHTLFFFAGATADVAVTAGSGTDFNRIWLIDSMADPTDH